MIQIVLTAISRDDARKHLRGFYPGCVLLDQPHGFDMLSPNPVSGKATAARIVLDDGPGPQRATGRVTP